MQVDISQFSLAQLNEIKIGFDAGLDVERYAFSFYDSAQMEILRLTLEMGLDIDIFDFFVLEAWQMEEIFELLLAGDEDAAISLRDEYMEV